MSAKLTSALTLLTLLHCACAFYPSMPASSQEAPPPTPPKRSAHFLADLILKNDCFAHYDSLEGISVCLKTKLLVNLNELIRSNKTVAIGSFSFVKTEPTSEVDNRLDESINEIPHDERSLSDESSQLTGTILKRAWQFFLTRSIKVNTDGDDASGANDEGRKKKEKGGGMMMMMGLGIKGMIIKVMMMKVAMIAMKALIIGKIALILSGILALKKLLMMQGGGGGGGDSHGHSSHGSSDWSSRRISLGDASASDMAYQGYAQGLKK